MNVTSTIRLGTPKDAPAMNRLIASVQELLPSGRAAQSLHAPELSTVPGERYVLVVDAPGGGLAAAAQVRFDGPRGHLGWLAIARDHRGEGLEHRLIAVAEALCDAFGCDSLDIPPSHAA
jgi:GNAT superfamily N-acetyltransferase